MRQFIIFLLSALVIGSVAYFVRNEFTKKKPVEPDFHNNTLNLSLNKLILPEGFTIQLYADEVENARSMTMSPNKTLFVGNRDGDKVYALRDEDGDFYAEKKYIIYSGGNMPNGVAFKNGTLYIAEVNRIIKFENIEQKLDQPGNPIVVYDKFPKETHHGWKYIAFGPDNKLYVPVGAPCNVCESGDSIFNTITRMNEDGSDLEIVQRGIRNSVGFTWHPDNHQLWFTDNGRDMLGEDVPNCELNHATKDFLHFGFPYCHQGDILDPEFGKGKKCEDYIKPAAKLGPHTAPLGIEYLRNNSFPEQYNNRFFIARHGSWNRTEKIGYDIALATIDENGKAASVTTFMSGWLSDDKQSVWGRPVDLEMCHDGSLLISDDYANCVYRVTYSKKNN